MLLDWVTDDEDSGDFEWDSEGDVAVASAPAAPLTRPTLPPPALDGDAGPSSSSRMMNGSVSDKKASSLVGHFVAMGFAEDVVTRVVRENADGDSEAILELLLTYSVIDEIPPEQSPLNHGSQSDEYGSDDGNEAPYSDSDFDDFDNKDIQDELSEKEKKVMFLVDMGFSKDEAGSAIERCGEGASVSVLADSIYAAQTAEELGVRTSDAQGIRVRALGQDRSNGIDFRKKRRMHYSDSHVRDVHRVPRNIGDADMIVLPNPMVGFSVPNGRAPTVNRSLPSAAVGPPYFYYENVALAPKGVWQKISLYLYGVEPEFVDSKYFCAANRKRGYIHNLPIVSRFPLLPMPPKTIEDAFPDTKKWWPKWDSRTHFNCLQTCVASARLLERIRSDLARSGSAEPPDDVKKSVMVECRKWNLTWIGVNRAAPLEPDECEFLLGFPQDHTRGISRTDRYRSLGNSFQVDTVAYHLSVLKDMFPNGMNVLSLFTGIGGAEVALHRLGIRMKNVVSVEVSEVNRTVLRSWWDQTKQQGQLYEFADVQTFSDEDIERFIDAFGGFDLVIGGSPCNNLAGSNRHHRDGLDGEQSALFYQYFRILDHVKSVMARRAN